MIEEQVRPSARADLYGGAFWVALGAVIFIASWRMDRLERLGVSYFTAPGLLPGILGLIIIACGVILVARSLPEGFARQQRPPLLFNRETLSRVGVTLALCLAFAIGLVGHGVPFWLAATLYLFAQIAVLEYPERGRGALLRAAIIAPIAAGVISFVFQQVFLVRLP